MFGRALIGGQKVIGNDTFVIQYGQSLRIFPFEDDFHFEVDIAISERNAIYLTPADDPKGGVFRIEIIYKNVSGSIMTSRPIIFALSDDFTIEYAISIAVSIIGPATSYTAMFSYTILEAGKEALRSEHEASIDG